MAMKENECRDCGKPTCPFEGETPKYGEWDWYVVRPEIWAEAVPDAKKSYSDGGYLHVLCLEERLGRELTWTDFDDAPLNADMAKGDLASQVLIDRLWSNTPEELAAMPSAQGGISTADPELLWAGLEEFDRRQEADPDREERERWEANK